MCGTGTSLHVKELSVIGIMGCFMRYVKLFAVQCMLLAAQCAAVSAGGMLPKISSKRLDSKSFFPQDVGAIGRLVRDTERLVREGVKKVIARAGQMTFENTILPIDRIGGRATSVLFTLRLLMWVHSDAKMREATQKGFIKIKKLLVDALYTNPNLYRVVKAYAVKNLSYEKLSPENLSEERRYYVDELLAFFELQGLALPSGKLARVRRLMREAAELEVVFETNITNRQSIPIGRDLLDGLKESVIAPLQRDKEGSILLPLDKSTHNIVETKCTIPETREKFWVAYNNRAYPANEKVLEHIVAKRDQFAHLVGFPSYAHLNIAGQMAQRPERVKEFLGMLATRTQPKYREELQTITHELPAGVSLTPEGLVSPWDIDYAINKGHTKTSLTGIGDYFPIDKTIEKVLSFLGTFLGITFEQAPSEGLWADGVTAFYVYEASGRFLGYLLLDLYPREGKYTRSRKMTIVPVVTDKSGNLFPGMVVIITNFSPKKTRGVRCFNLKDLTTLFHEMGHAVHALISRTELTFFFNMENKTDFLEVMSKLVEKFVGEPAVLKKISGHYVTGEPLSDDIIARICNYKKAYSGSYIEELIGNSQLCLACYDRGAKKDFDALTRTMHHHYSQGILYDDRVHPLCSFGHVALQQYGPAYYSYLWSNVIAADLFTEIERHGFGRNMGRRLVDGILRYGRGRDPEKLVFDFLGRKPNVEAFFAQMGF